MTFPIIDLHCDLLSYLAKDQKRTPYDLASRAAHPQLKAGGVILQTTAIYVETGAGSTEHGKTQVALFSQLVREHPFHFAQCSSGFPASDPVHLIAAFENASAFAEESEPLQTSLQRLEAFQKDLQRILYISMTWNAENRFGGGVGAAIGLKNDGKTLLDWMHGTGIAIDLSHASDRLAEEILSHIDHHQLEIPVIASHSNFRSITPDPRNLPDWLAQEIIRRQGLIGLNLFAPFIRTQQLSHCLGVIQHVEYGLSLGAQDTLCFGADFFYDSDFPSLRKKYQIEVAFFPEYSDASCYPAILELLSRESSLPTELLHKLAHGNARRLLFELTEAQVTGEIQCDPHESEKGDK